MRGADADSTAPQNSIAIGHQSLTAVTTGTNNTAIGYQSGKGVTSNGGNTSVGYKSFHKCW